MPVIKRYANRKLYDTESRRYVTVDEIADMVRMGDDVTVVDHVTGEDMTTLFLIQAMIAQERRSGGFLSGEFLSDMLRAGRHTVSQLYENFSASLDLPDYFTLELKRRFSWLVEEGKLAESEAVRLREMLLAVKPKETAEQGEDSVDPAEVARLLQQIEALESEIATYQKSG